MKSKRLKYGYNGNCEYCNRVTHIRYVIQPLRKELYVCTLCFHEINN